MLFYNFTNVRSRSISCRFKELEYLTRAISSGLHFLMGLSWSLKFVNFLAESLITGLRAVFRLAYIIKPLPFSKHRKFDVFELSS